MKFFRVLIPISTFSFTLYSTHLIHGNGMSYISLVRHMQILYIFKLTIHTTHLLVLLHSVISSREFTQFLVSQLSAYNFPVSYIPVVAIIPPVSSSTHSSPSVAYTDLYPSFILSCSTNQSYFTITASASGCTGVWGKDEIYKIKSIYHCFPFGIHKW